MSESNPNSYIERQIRRLRAELANERQTYEDAARQWHDVEPVITAQLKALEHMRRVRHGGASEDEAEELEGTPPAADPEPPPGNTESPADPPDLIRSGTTRNRIRNYLLEVQQPAQMAEIVRGVLASGSPARKDTIRGILYDMVERGEVEKVERGIYRLTGEPTNERLQHLLTPLERDDREVSTA